MSALDFPASPTVGQVATLTNGFSYQWDGAVWALAGSTGQAAGGDLTGTYPNPTLTPAAKSKWTDSGSLLSPVGAARLVAIPGVGGYTGGQLVLGTRTAKLRSVTDMAGTDWAGWVLNNPQAPDDSTLSSWLLSLSAVSGSATNDSFLIQRRPPGAAAGPGANWLILDGTGQLIIPGTASTQIVAGSRTIKGRLLAFFPFDIVALSCNDNFSAGGVWVQDDATKASWHLLLSTANDWCTIERRAAGGAATTPLLVDASGNLTIAGATATKASGTTWANPSDPRLKTDIAPYTRGVAEVTQLEPITYRLKADPDGTTCYGFDAAKVRPVFPECVTETTMKLAPDDAEPTAGVLSFDMHPIVVALVNAVKELSARVAALEATPAAPAD